MRTSLIFLLGILLSTYAFGQKQQININVSVKMDTVKVRKYEVQAPKDASVKTLFVPFSFNGSDIKNKKDLKQLNDGLTQIISVDYVYTQQTDKEAQEQLNKKRALELLLTVPFLQEQKLATWTAYEQLGFDEPRDAAKLYHGYVIKYRKITPYNSKDPVVIKRNIRQLIQKINDSTIYRIFSRNPEMKKDVIVADFTCSMSPYFLEVISWFCLKEFKNHKSYFAFFNDGDGKPNEQKVIGNTGGIYTFTTNNLDTVVHYIAKTTEKGCSGDEVENDVEALLRAMNDNPNCEEIILIADNWSDMRDFSLRTKIKKPVRVVLCNTTYGINLQYLTLAYQTKGSVHTIDEDLKELYQLKEGTKFNMIGHEFQVKGGAIVLVRKL